MALNFELHQDRSKWSEPARQTSRSKVRLVQQLLFGHTDTQRTHFSTWTTIVVRKYDHVTLTCSRAWEW